MTFHKPYTLIRQIYIYHGFGDQGAGETGLWETIFKYAKTSRRTLVQAGIKVKKGLHVAAAELLWPPGKERLWSGEKRYGYILSMYQINSFSILRYRKIVVMIFCKRRKAVSLFTT